jgi:hypothetical protein
VLSSYSFAHLIIFKEGLLGVTEEVLVLSYVILVFLYDDAVASDPMLLSPSADLTLGGSSFSSLVGEEERLGAAMRLGSLARDSCLALLLLKIQKLCLRYLVALDHSSSLFQGISLSPTEDP